MNEYFVIFQDVDKSIDTVNQDELGSLEIKQGAKNLKQYINPCFQEIELFVSNLNKLNQDCLNELNCAEDVFNSKKIIADLPNCKIWEQIGDISGSKSQINCVIEQKKLEAIQQHKNDWDKNIKELTNKYFYEYKNNFVNIFEKDNLVKDLHFKIQLQIEQVQSIIKKQIQSIIDVYKEEIKCLFQNINYLDKKNQIKIAGSFISIIESINELIDRVFIKRIYTMSVNVKGLIDSISNIADNLGKQGALGISWQIFKTSCEEVTTKCDQIIKSIFDEFIRLANQFLEEALKFYSDLLEKQMRYKQETLEQREAEKTWIQNQRQKLLQVQHGIEQILQQIAT